MTLSAIINTVYTTISNQALRALLGFTDGPNCDGSGTYTVGFSAEVTFTDHTDVTFVKNQGLAGEETLPATTSTTSPSSDIDYDAPAWAVALIAGDTITLVIGAGSNYVDDSFAPDPAVPIEAQSLTLVNCLDPTLGVTNLLVFGTGATVVSLAFVEPIDSTGLVYKLYRDNVYLTDLPLGSTSYVDNSALEGTAYKYKIDTLFNGKIISSTSTIATTQTVVIKTIDNKSAISLVFRRDAGLHQTLIAPRNSSAIEFNTQRFN